MNKILITGFEPFGGCKTNSSLEAVLGLENENTVILPVSYSRARDELLKAIEKEKPDFVLSFGQAGGADCVRLEKVGINLMSATIPDNDGVSHRDERLEPGAPDGVFTNCDIPALLDELTSGGISCRMSLSAGAYICNTVYYTALRKMNGNALFVHLPYLLGEGTPSMKKEGLVNVARHVLDYLKKI